MDIVYKKKSRLAILALALTLGVTACTSKEKEGLKQEELSQDVDENTGLKKESSMDIKFAENFKVDYLEGGYKLLTDASNRKTLLVPEGMEIPEDLSIGVNILQQPLEDVGIYSTIDASWFRPIGELSKISTVTFEKDSWRIPEIIDQLEDGTTTYIGKTSAVDFERLQAMDPGVHLISQNYEDRLFGKFEELEFPYLSMGAHLEEDPRGRMEWLKFVAAIFDKEDKAISYYDGQLDRIDRVVAQVEESEEKRPNVAIIYFSASKELFNVTNPIGHQSKMTELAGGNPYPREISSDGRSGVSMTNEEFYKTMEDADMVIYDNITGHLIQTKADLLEKADFVSDLKFVKEGRILGLQREYWQSADRVAELIENLHEFIISPYGELEENEFYFLMK